MFQFILFFKKKLASARVSKYFSESLPAIEPHVSLSTVDITVIA